MKTFLLFAILFFSVTLINGQCTSSGGFVCVPQATMDRISKDLSELAVARDTIAKLTSTIALSDSERALAQKTIQAANDVIAAKDKTALDYQQIIGIQAKALNLYSTLVQRLTDQINKPKSSFAKFVQTLEKLAILAAGIAVGVHL